MWIQFFQSQHTCCVAFEIPDNQGKPENTVNGRHLAVILGRQGFSCEITLNKFEMNVF